MVFLSSVILIISCFEVSKMIVGGIEEHFGFKKTCSAPFWLGKYLSGMCCKQILYALLFIGTQVPIFHDAFFEVSYLSMYVANLITDYTNFFFVYHFIPNVGELISEWN